LDVLTQVTTTPVLVLPHPDRDDAARTYLEKSPVKSNGGIRSYVWGRFPQLNMHLLSLQKEGSLILSHIEDKVTLDRYLDAIEKIPDIDSDVARETLYLPDCLMMRKITPSLHRKVWNEAGLEISGECMAQVRIPFGGLSKTYRRGQVDLTSNACQGG